MNKKYLKSGIMFLLFFLLIILLKTVDIAPIGAGNTYIGLSHLNKELLFDFNSVWYNITDCIGILSFLTAGFFAVVGALQLVERKSVFKIDKTILGIGILYIVTVIIYVLFEKIIVNYRPILMPESLTPEASFPSSHTMIVCVVMGSAIIAAKEYVKTLSKRRIINILCIVLAAVMVVGRLMSGVHWFTDVLGGVLVSGALLFALDGTLRR